MQKCYNEMSPRNNLVQKLVTKRFFQLIMIYLFGNSVVETSVRLLSLNNVL